MRVRERAEPRVVRGLSVPGVLAVRARRSLRVSTGALHTRRERARPLRERARRACAARLLAERLQRNAPRRTYRDTNTYIINN